MNFTTITNGTSEGFCLIKTVDKKVNVKGAAYLDLVLCDKSGEIGAKLWDYREDWHGSFTAGDLVKVRGTISQYNGADQFRVEKIRCVADSDNIDVSEFVPSAEYPGELMLGKIYDYIASFKDEQLKALTYALVRESEEKLSYWPAAFKLHHAMRGGLLYHTLSILRLAESVCALYPAVDRDLLFAGAILHDICKIDEFEISRAGIVTGYSVKGELLGHLVMGSMKIAQKARELGTDEETASLLEHMVISHHGTPDFGAAVRPMFLEAVILSQLDTLDATVFEIANAVGETQKGGFTPRQWALDNRKLYNHGRKYTSTKANLD